MFVTGSVGGGIEKSEFIYSESFWHGWHLINSNDSLLSSPLSPSPSLSHLHSFIGMAVTSSQAFLAHLPSHINTAVMMCSIPSCLYSVLFYFPAGILTGAAHCCHKLVLFNLAFSNRCVNCTFGSSAHRPPCQFHEMISLSVLSLWGSIHLSTAASGLCFFVFCNVLIRNTENDLDILSGEVVFCYLLQIWKEKIGMWACSSWSWNFICCQTSRFPGQMVELPLLKIKL